VAWVKGDPFSPTTIRPPAPRGLKTSQEGDVSVEYLNGERGPPLPPPPTAPGPGREFSERNDDEFVGIILGKSGAFVRFWPPSGGIDDWRRAFLGFCGACSGKLRAYCGAS